MNAPKPDDRALPRQALDRQIAALIQRRAELVQQQVAQAGLVDRSSRMAEAGTLEDVKSVLAASPGPLEPSVLRSIMGEIISACRAQVAPLRVAFLGPKYSFSYLAAVQQFGESIDLVPLPTIAAVFEEVQRKHSDYGLVPLENSTDGRIVDTLYMFAQAPVPICGEIQLRIHHNLLGHGTRERIRLVCSKPQALSQCRNWLAQHLPQAVPTAMASTTEAAQRAAQEEGVAAIASLEAGQHFGLDAIARNIEDNPDNITRFAVIGDERCPPSGDDKTTLLFEIAHRPGSLAETMVVFQKANLNLTWIESFPKRGTDKSEYLFFVSLEGHIEDPPVHAALEQLRNTTRRLDVLGSYRRTEPV